MKGKHSAKKVNSKKKNVKKHFVLQGIISFLEIVVAVFIVLIDKIFTPFKKTERKQKVSNMQEAPEVKKKNRHFKIPVLLKRRAAVAYLSIAAVLLVGGIYAFFSDRVSAETSLQAGTVLVKLEEDAPFNDLASISEEGADTNEKIFRAKSMCTLDTYVRARIIPVIEKYDEAEGRYVVIPVDVNDIALNISAPNWVQSDGYYYYEEILKPEALSKDVQVTVESINNSENYQDTNVRITLRVELEAAQVRNDIWKQIFNIESLPF